MGQPTLNASNQFGVINAEAQRGTFGRNTPPYATWHFASWPERRAWFRRDNKPSLARFDDRIKWLEGLNKAIAAWTGVPDEGFSILKVHPDEAGGLRSLVEADTLLYEKLSFSKALSLRVSLHEEFVEFSFFLQFKDPFALGTASPERPNSDGIVAPRLRGNPRYETEPTINDFVERLVPNFLRNTDEKFDQFRDRAGLAWDKLYSELWALAFSHAPAVTIPGKVFGNFRGLAVPRRWLVPAAGPVEFNAKKPDYHQWVPTDLTDLPSVPKLPDDVDPSPGFDPPKDPRRWNRVSAGRAVERNLALRHALHWPNGATPPLDARSSVYLRRTVATLIADGRALYLSAISAPVEKAFGAKVLDSDGDLERSLSRYAIFYCADADEFAQASLHRRLDRAVVRFHILGTLRLVALRDIKILRAAERKMEELLLNTRVWQPQFWNPRGPARLFKQLNAINNMCVGTLSFRIAWSDYYGKRFRVHLDDVNSIRIEGFEPYDEFVDRKLSSVFHLIQDLGPLQGELRDRFDRLLARRNSGYQTYFAIIATVFTGIATIAAVGALSFAFDDRRRGLEQINPPMPEVRAAQQTDGEE